MITYNGAFTGFTFSDFLLDQVSGKGRGGGDPNDLDHLQNRIALFVQDDFRVIQPDPEPRPALGLHVAAGREGQPPVQLRPRTGQQIFAQDGSLEDRALYKPYYKGFEPRLGFAWSASDRWVVRGGYGISQFMEGTGANLRLPLNPPLFFESAVGYNRTTGAGSGRERDSPGSCPGPPPAATSGPTIPNLRPQFTQQWNAFVEYQLTSSLSAQVGNVGHHADHLVTPVEGNQALAGIGDPFDLGAKEHAAAALRRAAARHHDCHHGGAVGKPLQRDAGEPAPAGVEGGSSCSGCTRWAKGTTNNRGFYGVFGGTGLGDVTSATGGRLLAEHHDPGGRVGAGVPRRAAQPGASPPPTSCRLAGDAPVGRRVVRHHRGRCSAAGG